MGTDLQSGSLSSQETRTELKINEIFFSIQGESSRVGLPTIFIRLTGCPLRCRYCDTAYAFHDGDKMTIDDIIKDISEYRSKYVTVTGGEPLAQRACYTLLSRLCDEGFSVSLETSGMIDIEQVDERVMIVMDIKTPASTEQDKNNYRNLSFITNKDQIKFVICNRTDYDWSKKKIIEHNLTDKCEVLFSPEHESVAAADLAEWILEDRLNVRMQVQMHKYLWGNVAGR